MANGALTLENVKQFAKQRIEENNRPNRYPFRSRYEHTLRVVNWAERLAAAEGGNLEVIQFAALLHDIGWDDQIEHALVGRQMAEVFLTSQGYPEPKKAMVLEAIEKHNKRLEDSSLLNLESRIIMDADILDEVGAMSIAWDAIAAATEPEVTYKTILDRVETYHAQLASRVPWLQTATGKKLYEERLAVYTNFIIAYRYELGIERSET